MTATISILLPAYNAQRYIRQATASIRNQTFGDFEAIIVDDASTDETGEIAQSLACADNRFRVVKLGNHAGIVNALNTALAMARAPYVCRMDADDIMHPRRLEIQYRYMQEHSQTDVLGSKVSLFSHNGITDGYRRYMRWLNETCDHATICRDIYVESPLAHPSVMMPAKRLAELGGYMDNGWPEDYDLWLRCFHAGYRFAKVAQTLLYWRDAPHRLSRTDNRYSIEQFHACKGYYLARHSLADRKTIIAWGAKRYSRILLQHLVNQGVSIAAYVDVDSKKIGNTINRIPVISPDDLRHFPRSYPIVSYVSRDGVREKIRSWLIGNGYAEGSDFFMAA